jgi:hypothetical protein
VATKATIFGTGGQEDEMMEQGHQAFMVKRIEIGKGSSWWFENIHPEDSKIKMSNSIHS